ncbi:MAG: kynureninase [Pseudomonadota bacterium]
MSWEDACRLDEVDPIAAKREEFHLPESTIYLDGNSLGPLPNKAKQRVAQVIEEEWGEDLISSWNKHHWIDLPERVGEKIAPLVGAAPGQLTCCDSISVNLFKLLTAALSMRPGRRVVLSQQDNFPTDLYIGQGLQSLVGEARCELKTVAADQLEAALDDSVAVLLLTEVNFRDGRKHDIARLTAQAHAHDILVIWDLAHSAGAFPVELDKAGVDFAVGCGYKYLNGGPGAPAFVYVASRHQDSLSQPLSGWMGHQAPFDFNENYQAADGVTQFQTGTPGIISMSALDAALNVFADVDLDQLAKKSAALSELFIQCLSEPQADAQLELVSPASAKERGSHLAYVHPQAFAISQALIAEGVIVDFRAPDIIRFGFAPLYIRYRDIWQACRILHDIILSKRYAEARFQAREKVT